MTDDDGRVYRGDIDHRPWTLRPARADVGSNTLFESNGFDDLEGEPMLHYADTTDVTAGMLHRW